MLCRSLSFLLCLVDFQTPLLVVRVCVCVCVFMNDFQVAIYLLQAYRLVLVSAICWLQFYLYLCMQFAFLLDSQSLTTLLLHVVVSSFATKHLNYHSDLLECRLLFWKMQNTTEHNNKLLFLSFTMFNLTYINHPTKH